MTKPAIDDDPHRFRYAIAAAWHVAGVLAGTIAIAAIDVVLFLEAIEADPALRPNMGPGALVFVPVACFVAVLFSVVVDPILRRLMRTGALTRPRQHVALGVAYSLVCSGFLLGRIVPPTPWLLLAGPPIAIAAAAWVRLRP